MTPDQPIEVLIQTYDLAPHPEGGWYKETFRSPAKVASPVHGKLRNTATHIYFLLGPDDISRFHRVVHDEIWNFYTGAPLNLISYDGSTITQKLIGPGCQDLFHVVTGGIFQAAESTGAYSLVGCTVTPGFDFEDFSFLSDFKDERSGLISSYPEFQRFL